MLGLRKRQTTCSQDALWSSNDASAGPAHALRVLFLHWGQAGAAAKFTYELVRAAANVEAVTAMISVAEGSELHEIAPQLEGVEMHVARTFRGGRTTWFGRASAIASAATLPRLAGTFRRIVARSRPDVIVCTFQSIWDLGMLPTLRRFPGRFVLILHDAAFHPGDDYPLRTRILRWEVEAADALVVLSDHVARAAERIHAFPADRIWMVPHGAFGFTGARRQPRRHPGHRKLRLLFLGRILAYKGIGLLLDSYDNLRASGTEVILEIAGAGDLRPYEAIIATLPDVTLRNHWLTDAEIAAALNRADLVVLPYVEASQSGVAAAALDAALPLVVTPVGGLAEQVTDGVTGVVARAVTPEDFADAIRRLVADPAFYERCSAAARHHADVALGWTGIAERLMAAARETASRPRRRQST